MPGGKKKRTFGVKTGQVSGKVAQGQSRIAREGETSQRHARTFGVKNPVPRGIPGVSGRMESCPEGCPGEYIEGMWIHSKECRWSAVLWRQYGKTEKDWSCPYHCPPQTIASGWTHQWDCAFWERTGRTPFDHRGPHGAAKVETAQGRSEQSGGVSGGRNESDTGSRGRVPEREPWQVTRARDREAAEIFKQHLPFEEDDWLDEMDKDDFPF